MQLTFFNLWNRAKKNKLKTSYKKKRTTKLKPSEAELLIIWRSLSKTYFPECIELDSYRINWSSRAQKRTLASCNLIDKKISVARELNYKEYKIWLEPLIFHEMCHAVLGLNVQKKNGKRQWHGSEFKRLEKSHPLMNSFDKWIKAGGWAKCVRSDRAKRMHAKRRIPKAS